jgi:hypothetical protein
MWDRRRGLRDLHGSKSDSSNHHGTGSDVSGLHHDPPADHHDHGAAYDHDSPTHDDGSSPYRPSDHGAADHRPTNHRPTNYSTSSSCGLCIQLHAVERQRRLLPSG